MAKAFSPTRVQAARADRRLAGRHAGEHRHDPELAVMSHADHLPWLEAAEPRESRGPGSVARDSWTHRALPGSPRSARRAPPARLIQLTVTSSDDHFSVGRAAQNEQAGA